MLEVGMNECALSVYGSLTALLLEIQMWNTERFCHFFPSVIMDFEYKI